MFSLTRIEHSAHLKDILFHIGKIDIDSTKEQMRVTKRNIVTFLVHIVDQGDILRAKRNTPEKVLPGTLNDHRYEVMFSAEPISYGVSRSLLGN